MTEITLICSALAALGTLCGCGPGNAPDPFAANGTVPIAERTHNYEIYAVAGWNKDSIRKEWGTPTRIVTDPKDFGKGINQTPKRLWSQLKDEEVEQWFYEHKSGMMQTLVTFDANGNAVRAICEWSDW